MWKTKALHMSAGLVLLLTWAPVASARQSAMQVLASDVANMSAVPRGLYVIVGHNADPLALELAASNEHVVHLWTTAPDSIAATRALADDRDISRRCLVVESGEIDRLPHATNTVDVIIAANLTETDLKTLPLSEAVRALRPQGKLLIGRTEDLPGLDRAASAVAARAWCGTVPGLRVDQPDREPDTWFVITRPALQGVDDWSHWEHGPDNNPVSTDQVIKAPYMTQFLAEPYYIAMPAITTAAGGRTFIAMGHVAHHVREEAWLNTLLARNGYNGTVLWTRKLPDGYLAHRSAFIATDDVFYMIAESGDGVVLLEPETGLQLGHIQLPEARGDWKWIAMKDGVLYALIGRHKDPPQTTVVRSERPHWSWGELSTGYYQERVPWGFGHRVIAYDMEKRKVLWTHDEDEPIDSRAMVIGGDRMYVYSPDSHLRSIDITCGEEVWTNNDAHLRKLIEQPGQGLGSTPGFRTMCYAVWTPKALLYEAQTRANIVAVSLDDGRILWHHPKTTNNPNVIYVDGQVLVGIGEEGLTQALDPLSGKLVSELGFRKRSCARLTATPDSLFCRGWIEGLTRFDRNTKEVLFNGAFRPSCNDGIIAANGLLYTGPWACDCNLALMGRLALCSAGDFDFAPDPVDRRLELAGREPRHRVDVPPSERDWPTYRADLERSASTRAQVPEHVIGIWNHSPSQAYQPAPAVAACGMIFIAGDDGRVRCIDAATGRLKWIHTTAGPILRSPTFWNHRVYVGSGDGFIYCLEAATGEMLWRFRAAPVERRTMIYGAICSTWPVNTGVLVEDGLAYAAAGIIDYDGTYVYALNAESGDLIWQNTTSGHLDRKLRKGVSAQGILTLARGRLWLPGGNIVSPAAYDLKTGAYVGRPVEDGSSKTNRGEYIGVLGDRHILYGGRLQYSSGQNVVNPAQFLVAEVPEREGVGPSVNLTSGRIVPAWNDRHLVMTRGKDTTPLGCDMSRIVEWLNKGEGSPPAPKWEASWLAGRDTVAMAMADNAVVGVTSQKPPWALALEWRAYAINPANGSAMWDHRLPGPAILNGVLVDRDGRVIVTLENGGIVCLGDEHAIDTFVEAVTADDAEAGAGRDRAITMLRRAISAEKDPQRRSGLITRLEKLGYNLGHELRKNGWIADWKLSEAVPYDDDNPADKNFAGEPDVDTSRPFRFGGRQYQWSTFESDDPDAMVDCMKSVAALENVAVYAYTEFRLPRDEEITLRIGSDDGFICWFNGQEVYRYLGHRGYRPESDVVQVAGKAGVNRLLLKVTQGGGGWSFGARVTTLTGEAIDLRGEQ